MKSECRRSKKAAWKRHKMDTDPKFKEDQYHVTKNGLKIVLVIGKNSVTIIQKKPQEIEHFKQSGTVDEQRNEKIKAELKLK